MIVLFFQIIGIDVSVYVSCMIFVSVVYRSSSKEMNISSILGSDESRLGA